eukprot:855571-Ditylum_brightwellii.AAC.1
MREDRQLWSILLWLTDSTPQVQLHQPDHSLCINKADTNENVQIQYKSVLDPHKILGHYNAPADTSR